MTNVQANKQQGLYWEVVVEKGTMKHVDNYDREVPDGGRRYDFVLRDDSGVDTAIMEVKSGEIADAGQISDMIKAASETEYRTFILGHPDPEYVLDLLEKHPELLEQCGQLGTQFIIKDLSALEDRAQYEALLEEKRGKGTSRARAL